MLVKYPHNFTGVHSGTTAQCNNAVRFKCAHSSGAGLCRCQGRIRLYIIEAGMYNSHGIQFIFNWFGVAVFVKERVCYDESTFLMHNGSQFIQGNRHTALLKVYLLRQSHPEHIFSPFSYGLNIN